MSVVPDSKMLLALVSDDKASDYCIDHALAFKRPNDTLYIVHCAEVAVDENGKPLSLAMESRAHERGKNILDKYLKYCAAKQVVNVSTILLSSAFPFESTLKFATQSNTNVIFIGRTNGYAKESKFFISFSMKIITHATCSVMVCRSTESVGKNSTQPLDDEE
jgi:nucleotide-binding universal stress UspA family protein